MYTEIFDMALNYGLWAVLFLGLLIYQLKDSRAREQKYQNTISELSKTLNKVDKIDGNLNQLSDCIVEVSQNVKNIETNLNILTTKKNKKREVNVESKNNGVLD